MIFPKYHPSMDTEQALKIAVIDTGMPVSIAA